MRKITQIILFISVAATASLAITGSGVFHTENTNAAAYCITHKFRKGSGYNGGADNRCVKEIQRLLNSAHAKYSSKLGSKNLSVDGKFGSSTQDSIKRLQAKTSYSNSPNTGWVLLADGVVGPETWGALCHFNGFSNSASIFDRIGCGDKYWYKYIAKTIGMMR